MQEVALSNDPKQIEFEIKQYEEMTGKGIYEIGRRLNWVKDKKLVFGEFRPFLKRVGISKSYANMFMSVAKDKELGNVQPDGHLGISVLYEFTKLPNEERDKPQQLDSGEVKKPDDMTRREIQELNRKLKQSEEANKTLDGLLSEKADTISALEQQVKNKPKPEVVEKTITKEVKPDDYDELKRQASVADDLKKQREQSQSQINKLQKELNDLKSRSKYQKVIDTEEADRQHRLSVLKVETAISIYSLIRDIQDFLKKENVLRDISKVNGFDDESKNDLQEANDGLQRFVDEVNQILSGRKIVEGKFTE